MGNSSTSEAGLSLPAGRIDPLGTRGNLSTENGMPCVANNGNDMNNAMLGGVEACSDMRADVGISDHNFCSTHAPFSGQIPNNNLSNAMGNSSSAGLSLAAARIDPLGSGDNLSTVTNGLDSASLAGLPVTAVRIDPLGSGYKLPTHVQGNNLSNVCGLSSNYNVAIRACEK